MGNQQLLSFLNEIKATTYTNKCDCSKGYSWSECHWVNNTDGVDTTKNEAESDPYQHWMLESLRTNHITL